MIRSLGSSIGVSKDEMRTYTFTLTLTPKTFNGPAITAAMRVVVSNP